MDWSAVLETLSADLDLDGDLDRDLVLRGSSNSRPISSRPRTTIRLWCKMSSYCRRRYDISKANHCAQPENCPASNHKGCRNVSFWIVEVWHEAVSTLTNRVSDRPIALATPERRRETQEGVDERIVSITCQWSRHVVLCKQSKQKPHFERCSWSSVKHRPRENFQPPLLTQIHSAGESAFNYRARWAPGDGGGPELACS